MDILIKNIEMPANGRLVLMITKDMKVYIPNDYKFDINYGNNGLADKAVALPPHGRLIDADKLDNRWYRRKRDAIEAWNTRNNPWHAGTPTGKGEYLLALMHKGKIRYSTNTIMDDGSFEYAKLGEIVGWMPITLYGVSKENA